MIGECLLRVLGSAANMILVGLLVVSVFNDFVRVILTHRAVKQKNLHSFQPPIHSMNLVSMYRVKLSHLQHPLGARSDLAVKCIAAYGRAGCMERIEARLHIRAR